MKESGGERDIETVIGVGALGISAWNHTAITVLWEEKSESEN